MIIDTRGAILEGISKVDVNSIIGKDYIAIWDKDGMLLHINKNLIDYLYNGLHPNILNQQSVNTSKPSNNVEIQDNKVQLNDIFNNL